MKNDQPNPYPTDNGNLLLPNTTIPPTRPGSVEWNSDLHSNFRTAIDDLYRYQAVHQINQLAESMIHRSDSTIDEEGANLVITLFLTNLSYEATVDEIMDFIYGPTDLLDENGEINHSSPFAEIYEAIEHCGISSLRNLPGPYQFILQRD